MKVSLGSMLLFPPPQHPTPNPSHPLKSFCKKTKLQTRNREKRSDTFGVCWLNFTNSEFMYFFLLQQGRWKLDGSLAALNQKAENIALLFWKEGLDEKEGDFWLRVCPDTQEKRWAFGWGLHQKSRDCTQRPFLPWSDSSCTQGSRICELFYKCAWIHCWSLLESSSEVLYFGWLFYITSFIHSLWMFYWRKVSVSKKTIYSLFSLGPEAWDAGPLWGSPAVPKSTAYTWEKVLILHEVQ